MKPAANICLVFLILSLNFCSLYAGQDLDKRWKTWLDEVDPIMAKTERSVFESLKTEEDRLRFQKLFWDVRDPNRETIENEFKNEYYTRLRYAQTRLGGIKSDRGLIYMILGEPVERNNYSGSDKVVDCEVWIYFGENRPGLPPTMNLIFYKPRDVGNYRLFYPGIHTAKDIIGPGYTSGRISDIDAYREVRQSFPQLAMATLSVIPGEGSLRMPASGTSSSQTFSQIFSLPEKEARSNYLRSFQSVEGEVDVTYSFKELPGNGFFALSLDRGYRFLNYQVLVENLNMRQVEEGIHAAHLNFNLKIEDSIGKTIYQRERNIELRLSFKEKEIIKSQGVVFSDLVPVIEGDFTVLMTLSNLTTEEFFSMEEEISISKATIPVLIGYRKQEVKTDNYLPFGAEGSKIYADPRSIFNKTDSLQGMIFSQQSPEVRLVNYDNPEEVIPVSDIIKLPKYYVFKQPLENLRASDYYLIISCEGKEIYKSIVSVLPFIANKPKGYEWSDPPTAGYHYTFELAKQYLNQGDPDSALEYLERIPDNLRDSEVLSTFARSFYMRKDYAKVLETLEEANIIKDYSNLLMLGNAALELRKLPQAATYFEQLREYGDTAQINRTLGAIYLSMGDREKAKVYFARADELEKK